jgi:proteasome assembly chaperone (PAC2) family protein
MDLLRWDGPEASRPILDRPILVAAFEGWNDAGDAATTAARHLSERWQTRRFASIDPEEFFDFSSTRPTVSLNGGRREIQWPANEFHVGRTPSGRDVIVLLGNEPQLRWRTFCALVLEVAQWAKVELVLTLGALLADVPHSRPVRVTGTAADPALVATLGLERSRYEGPTGIVGVLHEAFGVAGIASASIWGAVPHYLPGTPSPKVALALVQRAGELLDSTVSTIDLEIATAEYERQVDEVVEADEDMVRYVRQLEENHDEGDDDDDEDDESPDVVVNGSLTDQYGNLPTGDALAAELERYLRDQS